MVNGPTQHLYHLPSPPKIFYWKFYGKSNSKIDIKFKTSNLNAIQTKSDIKISKILIF